MSNIRERAVFLRLTDSEYEQINQKADLAETTLTNYVREAALNGTVKRLDYNGVFKHTDEIASLNKAIKDIIYAESEMKLPYQEELQQIDKLLHQILDVENKMLKTIRKNRTGG